MIARTRSEIRVVLLSISFNRFAISTEAAIRTSAARGDICIKGGEQRLQYFRLDSPARQIGRQLPQVVLPVAAQQGINLVFQIADGQSIERGFVGLHEGSFQLFDLRFLRRRKLVLAQFLHRSLDPHQRLAQLAGGALGGRGRIVQFVRQSRGKLAQSGQPVALLLQPGGFADAVGHQAHQPLRQLRHFLYQFRKSAAGNFRTRLSVSARPVTTAFFILEKGSTPVISPALQ